VIKIDRDRYLDNGEAIGALAIVSALLCFSIVINILLAVKVKDYHGKMQMICDGIESVACK
jgi:hypothetical protein